MKSVRYILVLALLAAPAALAQIAGQPTAAVSSPVGSVNGPPPVTIGGTVAEPPCEKNVSFYAAGASFNKAATPNLGGLFVIGVPLTCSSTAFQIYSYTEHNLVPVGSGNNLSFKDTTSSGFATPLRRFGIFDIFAFGNVGVTTQTATPVTSGNVSINGAYGVFAAFPIWKSTAWKGIVAAQKVAGNNTYSFLFGRSF